MVRLKWGGAGAGLPAIPRQTARPGRVLLDTWLADNILVEGYGYQVGTSLLGGLAGIDSILMKVNIPRRNRARSLLIGNLVQPYTSSCTSANLTQKMHPAGCKQCSVSQDNALVAHLKCSYGAY